MQNTICRTPVREELKKAPEYVACDLDNFPHDVVAERDVFTDLARRDVGLDTPDHRHHYALQPPFCLVDHHHMRDDPKLELSIDCTQGRGGGGGWDDRACLEGEPSSVGVADEPGGVLEGGDEGEGKGEGEGGGTFAVTPATACDGGMTARPGLSRPTSGLAPLP
jgi:hypothetical protein